MTKVRMGMVGGGHGAFIGQVHRMASQLDGEVELVCGAFSSDADRSVASGRSLYLPESRCYSDFNQMLTSEALLPESERMDFVAVVTPNHLHFSVAKAALEAGFHVLSDKPAKRRTRPLPVLPGTPRSVLAASGRVSWCC